MHHVEHRAGVARRHHRQVSSDDGRATMMRTLHP
jgi:hypothetical protein